MFLRKWGKIGTTTPVIGGKYLYLYRSYYAFSLSSRMQGHLCGEEGNRGSVWRLEESENI